METIKNLIKDKGIIESELKQSFYKALQNKDFKYLRDMIPLKDEVLYKYTSLLEDSVKECSNCKTCNNILSCNNELKGYRYFPTVKNDILGFEYVACKFNNSIEDKYSNMISLFNEATSLKEARIKNIFIDDKSRVGVVKYIDKYYKNYFKNREKSLYLYGNFGSGKTYIISALFNELARKEIKSAIVYFPEFLRTLKSSFSDFENGTFENKFEYIKKVQLLLIDDIGAENVTAWSRDEILGTILQYRMQENLPTFFTSNLNLNELETHLSITSNSVDKVKARRIIERIKYLSNEMELLGINRRD